MLSQETAVQPPQIQFCPIDRLVFYARKQRESDVAVDSMPLPTLRSSWTNQGK
jgi:hypothetical protein